MVTIQPPMVIDTPPHFSEGIHERQSTQWDEELESYKLRYMRPVLFSSCNGELALKGWVGNENVWQQTFLWLSDVDIICDKPTVAKWMLLTSPYTLIADI